MWIPPLIPLFLALVLIPDPGISQQAVQHVLCSDCKKVVKMEISTTFLNEIRSNVKGYTTCPPPSENIRFQLASGVSICAQKHLTWVKQLMECLDGDSKCLSDTSQKEFSKGTNEKPFTTTTNAPTTAPVTIIKPSTQSWGHTIGQSTEPAKPGTAMATSSPVAPRDLNTTPLDSNNANINLAQGKDKSIEHQNAEDKQNRKCLSDTCSNSQKEFSKGTNEKPFTTTTNAPTTAPVTSIKPSTQSWGHTIGQSTEPAKPGTAVATASPVAPRDLNTTPLDSNNANINQAQGKDKSIEHQNAEDKQSKEKNMQIAIISLILIVLILVAVVVGFYCRKKKRNQFNTPCGSRPVGYTAASSEDSIIEVNAEQ